MKRERGLVFLVPEGRFSGGQEGDSWWDENRRKTLRKTENTGFLESAVANWLQKCVINLLSE